MAAFDPIDAEISSARTTWEGSRFYDNAESRKEVFWAPGSPFFDSFRIVNSRGIILEFACGKGRHSERLVKTAKRLILADLLKSNVEATRLRLSGWRNVEFFVSDGSNLSFCKNNSVDTVFSFDDMVHFSSQLSTIYLGEISRVLKPGGRAILHHSNLDDGNGNRDNPHGRTVMTNERFADIAKAAGLKVLTQTAIEHGGIANLDGITVLELPALSKNSTRRTK